jgi:hypothetical protein
MTWTDRRNQGIRFIQERILGIGIVRSNWRRSLKFGARLFDLAVRFRRTFPELTSNTRAPGRLPTAMRFPSGLKSRRPRLPPVSGISFRIRSRPVPVSQTLKAPAKDKAATRKPICGNAMTGSDVDIGSAGLETSLTSSRLRADPDGVLRRANPVSSSEPTAAVGNPPTDAANWNRCAESPPERKNQISHQTQNRESGTEDFPLHAPSLRHTGSDPDRRLVDWARVHSNQAIIAWASRPNIKAARATISGDIGSVARTE